MNVALAFETLKSQDFTTQTAIVDRYTAILLPHVDTGLRPLLANDPFDTSQIPPADIVRYILLALYAADVSTIPDAECRAMYLAGVRHLASFYRLNLTYVLYLTRYESQLLRHLQSMR